MKIFLSAIILFLFILFPKFVSAENPKNFITVVSPVRDKIYWRSKESVIRQINLFISTNIPSTWLLQYSLLKNDEAIRLFRNLPQSQEIGVFLEVDENLANDARVPYKYGEGDWARSDKVLLSGYNPQERMKMIDLIFEEYKNIFGRYPSSVGAWYIDSISLKYIDRKYGLKTVLVVSDQYQTDTYGLWGQPWGIWFKASRLNPLIPFQEELDLSDYVTIQWAQRDPIRGYGLTVFDSTYSMQANDYIGSHQKDISYFDKLSSSYLFSPNSTSQLTIGLEAGQEGAGYFDELQNQLSQLKKITDERKAIFVTMSGFADIIRNLSNISQNNIIYSKDGDAEAYWFSSNSYRIGLLVKDNRLYIRDFRIYSLPFAFADILDKESEAKLKRIIPSRFDEALRKDSRMLLDNINNIQAHSLDDSIVLDISAVDMKKHQLILMEDQIALDSINLTDLKNIYSLPDIFRKMILTFLMEYSLIAEKDWFLSFRYSIINGYNYFGFMISPDILAGMKLSFPYFGIYHFPFQTLIHFKTLPETDWIKILGINFIKYSNNSTMKRVSEINL